MNALNSFIFYTLKIIIYSFRRLCAAPKIHIANNIGACNYYELCTNDPDVGSNSKYCKEHSHLNETDSKSAKKPVPTAVQNDLRPQTRAWTKKMTEQKSLPKIENDNGPIGCREEKNINKFFDRTAGVISIVRGCKLRLRTIESYTKESSSQLVMALVDCFGLDPKPEDIRCVVADVACGLSKFLDERGKLNETLKK